MHWLTFPGITRAAGLGPVFCVIRDWMKCLAFYTRNLALLIPLSLRFIFSSPSNFFSKNIIMDI